MMALALGAVAALRSLRAVEALTAGLNLDVRRRSKIMGRFSDTKLRDTLLGLRPKEVRWALHHQVKAEHRRGNLVPTRLPFGVVAIDGKWLSKLDEWGHPDVQPVRPEGKPPYGLARVHRAHLVSSDATVCVDERPIPGRTNELGAVCVFTKELITAYRRTELFEVITADAGNCSLKHASLIHGHNLGYVLAIKEPAGELYREALRQLADLGTNQAEVSETRQEKGTRITHRLFRVTIRGFLDWTHALALRERRALDSRCRLAGRRAANTVDPSPACCLCAQRAADDRPEHLGCSAPNESQGIQLQIDPLARSGPVGSLRFGWTSSRPE